MDIKCFNCNEHITALDSSNYKYCPYCGYDQEDEKELQEHQEHQELLKDYKNLKGIMKTLDEYIEKYL